MHCSENILQGGLENVTNWMRIQMQQVVVEFC